MKKIIALLLTVAISLFCGFGCGELSVLTVFSPNAWNGGNAPVLGFEEQTVYNVSLMKDGTFNGNDFKRSSSLSQDLDYDISGTYTVSLKVLSVLDFPYSSDITEDTSVTSVIKVETDLELTAVYDYNGQHKESNDSIKDLFYICQGDMAFAPLYSERTFDYTLINASQSVSFSRTSGKTSALFNKTAYTVNTELTNPETGDVISTDRRTANYNYKTLIANEELLFALRNVNVETEKSVSLPTESFAYSTYKTLSVTGVSDNATVNVEGLTYNGTAQDPIAFKTRCLSYKINAQQSGRSQLVYIQNGSVSGILNRSTIIRYVEPISEYGNQLLLGALVYTVSDITVS